MASQFQFGEILGKGGFSTVFRATDSVLRREVAIKFVNPSSPPISTSDDHARALAKINHPAVVGVYHSLILVNPETGEEADAIVMELVPGVTLEEALQGPPSSPEVVWRVGNSLIEGLAAIHAAGIAHMDLHDRNVMLANSMQPKILDIFYQGTRPADASAADLVRIQRKDVSDLRGLIQRMLDWVGLDNLSTAAFRRASTLPSLAEAFEGIESTYRQDAGARTESRHVPDGAEIQSAKQFVSDVASLANFEYWEAWTSWKLSSDPTWTDEDLGNAKRLVQLVSTGILPPQLSELRRAGETLGRLLFGASQIFMAHAVERAEGVYRPDRFYKTGGRFNPHYDRDSDLFQVWEDLCDTMMHDATKAANWFASCVRRDVDSRFYCNYYFTTRDSETPPLFDQDTVNDLPGALRHHEDLLIELERTNSQRWRAKRWEE